MHNVDCILCGSHDKSIVMTQAFPDDYLELINPEYQKSERNIVRCNGCGFVYRDPQLNNEDLEILYEHFRDMSFRSEAPDAYFDRITNMPPERSENTIKVQWLQQNLPELLSEQSAQGKKILDIGCGGGVFLHTFRTHNPQWQVHGVEPTPAFAELAGRRLASPVLSGNYHSKRFDTQFDLITINQVLEHVQDPIAFLRDVRHDLAPNGRIYLEVPDIRDLEFLPPDHDRFLMQHLWIFSATSLHNVCRQAGFEVLLTDHQVTLRNKRNVVVVLAVNA